MICTKHVLIRALAAHTKYLPTASEHLRVSRAAHIPVQVRSAASKKAVREAAELALLHGPSMGSHEARAAFDLMSEPHRIAVCLTAMQGFAELLAGIAARGGEYSGEYTDNVFGLLDSVSIDHAALAIRNCGQRDGGPFTIKIIQDFKLTRSSTLMRVYFAISAHWNKVGMDWKRRAQEEADLAAKSR